MADISKITDLSGTTYNIKDATNSTNVSKAFMNEIHIKNDSTSPHIYFGGSDAEDYSGRIHLANATDGNGNYGQSQFFFYQYGPTNDASVRSQYFERYALPETNVGKTGNSLYNILTSKNEVTVAQGGTGASNASDARDNLGLGTMAVRNLTASSVAANKSVSIESVPNGALVVAYVSASHRYFGYKRGNANMCPLINEGSITVSSSAGTVTITNGTSSTCYYGIIGG